MLNVFTGNIQGLFWKIAKWFPDDWWNIIMEHPVEWLRVAEPAELRVERREVVVAGRAEVRVLRAGLVNYLKYFRAFIRCQAAKGF